MPKTLISFLEKTRNLLRKTLEKNLQICKNKNDNHPVLVKNQYTADINMTSTCF